MESVMPPNPKNGAWKAQDEDDDDDIAMLQSKYLNLGIYSWPICPHLAH